MTQIKIFTALSLSGLETQINTFLMENQETIEFVDLQKINYDGYGVCLIYKKLFNL